jgi:hypothetical protein
MLQPKDDLRHPLRPGPHSRESLFYNALLPDQEMMIFIYTWVDAANNGGHLVTVVGDNNVRHAISATDGVPVGDRDFHDWEVQGLRLRHSEPLERAEIGFTGNDMTLEATFTGLHPAFDYAQNRDGCPRIIADNRFEQSGRITGTLTLNGRTIEFSTTGHRDHSWGTRDWDSIQDWKWVSAQAGADLSLNVMQMHWRGETTQHGYVYRDGKVHPVTDIRTRAHYDNNWWQTALEMTLRDDGGHDTVVTANRYALLRFEAGEKLALHEAGCHARINGQPGVAHFECGWDKAYAAAQAERVASGAD